MTFVYNPLGTHLVSPGSVLRVEALKATNITETNNCYHHEIDIEAFLSSLTYFVLN